jgi:hypothetical protein
MIAEKARGARDTMCDEEHGQFAPRLSERRKSEYPCLGKDPRRGTHFRVMNKVS